MKQKKGSSASLVAKWNEDTFNGTISFPEKDKNKIDKNTIKKYRIVDKILTRLKKVKVNDIKED